jgi:uncharacterized membrane protein
MLYLWLKMIHILAAIVMVGIGSGSVFYKFRADRGGDLREIAFANKNVVLADWIFTAPSVIIQPITGFLMARIAGYPLTQTWILLGIIFYITAGLCWLPAVYLQIRMRDISLNALAFNEPLPPLYRKMYKIWCWLGVGGFLSVIIVIYVMVFKPSL